MEDQETFGMSPIQPNPLEILLECPAVHFYFFGRKIPHFRFFSVFSSSLFAYNHNDKCLSHLFAYFSKLSISLPEKKKNVCIVGV